MLGQKSLAVRCFRSALSLLDTRSPPGLATAPPKPPPPEPAPPKAMQRPATAPAGKGKAAPPRAPAWGGGGSLDTPTATTAAANLRRVLQASFANNLNFSTIPSHQHPHSSRFPYPSYGRAAGGATDKLPPASASLLQGSVAPSNSSGLQGGARPSSAHPATSMLMAQNLAKASASPRALSGFALASNPAPSAQQRHQHLQQPLHSFTGFSPGTQNPSMGRPSTAPSRPTLSASLPTSFHTAMGMQRPSAAGATFQNTEGTMHVPSPLKTFISSVISSQPPKGPVESVPAWAVRATEASVEEKVKKKGGSSGSSKPAPKKGGDGKGAPKKKNPAGFQLTYPAEYYGQPSYSVANIKGLAAPKKGKGAAKKG
ncbi:hypothetical protein DUNSADRAFT_8753 [Dunaliella salina]|uniref:Uncharacterized protein n=1 Tax=Dunaliella salina TaxID=3046 RepID=A0ABQ7GIV0_DUNSA|nr:hypothetical protein DUNSADRAFT_8753 [Dunaliella salina]|eukprot:KAF5834545.1 hypothetical protein DUNSADRAFT_8753 [Dunaliella salina]